MISRLLRCPLPLALVACLAAAAGAAAAEHPAATPQREALNAGFLAYAPPPPAPSAACIIDSGVDANPDTEAALLYSEAVRDDQIHVGDTDSVKKHGTRVLSVAAAPRNGWGTVGLWPHLRAVSLNGTRPTTGTFPFNSYRLGIRRCLTLATLYPITSINLSLGSEAAPTDDETTLLLHSVSTARNNGIHVVAAAGNSGGPIETPASLDGVLAVGGSDPASGALCAISARGDGLDLVLPGCGVALAGPTGDPIWGSGLSYSAPMASAVLSALRAYQPSLGVDEAEALVRASAVGNGGVVDVRGAFIAAGLGGIVAEGERLRDEAERSSDDDGDSGTGRDDSDTGRSGDDARTPWPPPGPAPGPADDQSINEVPRPSRRPRSDATSRSGKARWERPRTRVRRKGQRILVTVVRKPARARLTAQLQISRTTEFTPPKRVTRSTRGNRLVLTVPAGMPARRLSLRVWLAGDRSRRPSPSKVYSAAALRAG